MLVSTGTPISLIDIKAANQLKISMLPLGRQTEKGFRVLFYAPLPSTLRVEIGSFVSKQEGILGADLSAMSRWLGQPIAGVLGYSFLKHRVVQIDYPGRVIRVLPSRSVSAPDRSANSAKLSVFALSAHTNLNLLLFESISVDGKLITGSLDTGLDDPFALSPYTLEHLALRQAPVDQEDADATPAYPQKTKGRKGLLRSLKVGSEVVEDPIVSILKKDSRPQQELKSYGIVLGNGYLKNYVVTIDCPGKLVTLESR